MKNLFKFGFIALAMSLTFAACNTNKTTESADSTAVDSTMVDTTMMDTTVVDTTVVDTAATDSVQ
ncbi:MAG TPA: hypothetical protein VGD22_01420 [Sphingobacteriaceae bacterium]